MIVNQDAGALLPQATALGGAAPARPLDNAGQAGWLYQLEHAMLSEAAPGSGAPAAAAPRGQATAATPTAATMQPGAALAPAPPTGTAGPAMPAWNAWALQAVFAAPAPGPAVAALARLANAASAAGAAGQPGAQDAAAAPPLPQRPGSGALALLARGSGAGAGTTGAGNEAATDAATAARTGLDGRAASLAAAAEEAYAATKLHVYQDGAGVQAWLRDAALDAAQAPALMRSMAAQLGADGARLSALTVNGKTLPAAAPRGDQFIHNVGTDGGHSAASAPSSHAQGAA